MDQHRVQTRTYRPSPELHKKCRYAALQQDTTVNAVVIELLRWYVGETNRLPPRPDWAEEGAVETERAT